jgi:hypothetical protein
MLPPPFPCHNTEVPPLRFRTAFALVALVTIPLIPAPAGAAVPNRPATVTLSCADGTTDKAKFWEYDGTTSGVRNRCDHKWLVIVFSPEDDDPGYSGPSSLSVAPHVEARFAGAGATHHNEYRVYVGKPETCAPGGSYLLLQGHRGGVTQNATCGVTPKKHVKYYS